MGCPSHVHPPFFVLFCFFWGGFSREHSHENWLELTLSSMVRRSTTSHARSRMRSTATRRTSSSRAQRPCKGVGRQSCCSGLRAFGPLIFARGQSPNFAPRLMPTCDERMSHSKAHALIPKSLRGPSQVFRIEE